MDNKICKIHNVPAQFCKQDAQQNFILLCNICIQQKFEIYNIEDVENKQRQTIQQLESKYDQKIKQLNDFVEKFEQYIQQIQEKLKKFKQQVDDNRQYLIEKKNQLKNKNKDFNSQPIKVNEMDNTINNQITQIQQLLQIQLKEIENIINLDTLYSTLDSLSIVDDDDKKNTVIDKKFDYQLVQQSSYQQNEWCSAIAFNKKGSIMIAGCKQLIKIFEFNNHTLSLVSKLKGHQSDVNCLKFLNKSNQFISASDDGTIRIWEHSNNSQWRTMKVLKDHTAQIYCLTINQKEDLLISGSEDQTIKFWNKQNNIWSCNQSIDCNYVYSTSLNDSEDMLIASVDNKQILIIQLQSKLWMIKQNLQVEQHGYRLCFIKQNQFVFQPYNRSYLQIFNYGLLDQTFQKGQEIQYLNKVTDGNCLFPIYYVSQIGLIMVKNDQYLHLFKRDQNDHFIVEQSINFNTFGLYGCITDDGRYIATWDNYSKEIQIRKFDY